MRVVAALGGNALLRRGEPVDAEFQLKHLAEAVTALAPLADHHELVLTHGNGPQVGLLAEESAADPHLNHPLPARHPRRADAGDDRVLAGPGDAGPRPGRKAAALITQTVVRGTTPRPHSPPSSSARSTRRTRRPSRRTWSCAPTGGSDARRAATGAVRQRRAAGHPSPAPGRLRGDRCGRLHDGGDGRRPGAP